MKKLVSAALIILFSFVICSCSTVNDEVSKETIEEYVIHNQEKLNSFPESDMPIEQNEQERFLRDVLGADTIVKKVYRYNNNILEFYCGGKGLITNSEYSGFYYSADNTPFAFEFPTSSLKETSPGVFERENDSGESIITQRIIKNWFYYHIIWH